MILSGTAFLAARTTRSQAYAQALLRAGLVPQSCLVYGEPGVRRLGQSDGSLAVRSAGAVVLHDPTEALETTLEKLGCPVRFLAEGSVSSPALAEALAELAPELAIYSGYGGEIVPAALCRSYRFLHVHGGWLPDYRGSTTQYYSLLRENSCGASALLLSPSIDTGPVVMRRRYPPPPPGVDIDHLYDSALRADLLVRVLERWADQGPELELFEQDPGQGRTYFVVHPVLKNVALERLLRRAKGQGKEPQ